VTKANDRYGENGRAHYPQRAVRLCRGATFNHYGYTVVELMVTIVIVSVLAATVGMFFVKLLNIQEKDREEAYIREKLSDICGAYADMLSIGSSFSTFSNLTKQATLVKYRQETGGVSLETGVVSRVAYLTSLVDMTIDTLRHTTDYNMGLTVFGLDPESDANDLDHKISSKLARSVNGNAALIPLLGDMVSCTITPLGIKKNSSLGIQEKSISVDGMSEQEQYLSNKLVSGAVVRKTNAVLGWLEVKARYKTTDKAGNSVWTNTTAGRVVRLWNNE